MKVAIVGSRDFRNIAQVAHYVRDLPADTEVVSGGAHGVDKTAEVNARSRGLVVTVFKPDWKQFGRSAGMIRNHSIVAYADRVVVFYDGMSSGTGKTIEIARRLGKPLEIHYSDGRIERS